MEDAYNRWKREVTRRCMKVSAMFSISEEKALGYINAILTLRIEEVVRAMRDCKTWRELQCLTRTVEPALRSLHFPFGKAAVSRHEKLIETVHSVALTDHEQQPSLGVFIGSYLGLIVRQLGPAMRMFRHEKYVPDFADIYEGESGVNRLTLVHLLHSAAVRGAQRQEVEQGHTARGGKSSRSRDRRARDRDRAHSNEHWRRPFEKSGRREERQNDRSRQGERPYERGQGERDWRPSRPTDRDWRASSAQVRPRHRVGEQREGRHEAHSRTATPPPDPRCVRSSAGPTAHGPLEGQRAHPRLIKPEHQSSHQPLRGATGGGAERGPEGGEGEVAPPALGHGVPLEAVPREWGEREATHRWYSAREENLPFLTRRRALKEKECNLLKETLPCLGPPPRTGPQAPPAPPIKHTVTEAPRPTASLPANDAESRSGESRATAPLADILKPEAELQIRRWLRAARELLRPAGGAPQGGNGKLPSLVLSEEEVFQPWARGHIWDCRDPTRCVRVAPTSRHKPPPSSLNGKFIAATAERLNWPDQEMVEQILGGVDDGAKMPPIVALHFHHQGLRRNLAKAEKAVADERTAGFLSRGFDHLAFLPCVLTPHNVVLQPKWFISEDGTLASRDKVRVTTDDSWTAHEAAPSRNGQVSPEEWPPLQLPTARDAARAAAILQVGAARAARHTPVKVILRDLQSAYRYVGIQANRLWLQCFIWGDGVTVDERLGFGAAFNVQIFQRFTSMLLAEARRRIRAWDEGHPPSDPGLQEWREMRGAGQNDMSYLQVYLDDACAVVIDDKGPGFEGGRAAVHFQIIGEVFEAAGFAISTGKDQLAEASLVLGFLIDTPERRISYPPEKQEVLKARVDRALSSFNIAYRELESLTGTLCHLCTVLPEGKQQLHPLYTMLGGFPSVRRTAKAPPNRATAQGWRRAHPTALALGGQSAKATAGRAALEWFAEVLRKPAHAPLAPRLHFPAPGSEPGAAFMFVDASREWGLGGWALSASDGPEAPLTFQWFALPYPPHLAKRIAEGESSTGAIELAAAAVGQQVLLPHAQTVTCFTDSEAARGAINSGASGAASMRPILEVLFGAARVHWFACRVTTTENERADKASRGDAAMALAQAKRQGWRGVQCHIHKHLACSVMTALAAGMNAPAPHPTPPPPPSRAQAQAVSSGEPKKRSRATSPPSSARESRREPPIRSTQLSSTSTGSARRQHPAQRSRCQPF